MLAPLAGSINTPSWKGDKRTRRGKTVSRNRQCNRQSNHTGSMSSS